MIDNSLERNTIHVVRETRRRSSCARPRSAQGRFALRTRWLDNSGELMASASLPPPCRRCSQGDTQRRLLAVLLGLLGFISESCAQLLGDGGHHSLESDTCTMATFTDRTEQVDSICCNQANSIADVCLNGVPQNCDRACAGVYIPWFEECSGIIETIVDEHLPVYSDVFERCQAGDTATLFTLIHTATMNGECEIHLPHTPISSGCFDVGCAIADAANVAEIDGVASAAACQELCAQEPECMFFLFRTDGGTGIAQNEEEQFTSGPNCRLKPASSQSRIYTNVDGWPGVCGPKTCKEVVEEFFHFDTGTGFQGWQVLGDGVTTHAANFGQETQSHVYQAHDCPPNEDCAEDPADQNWGTDKVWGIIPWPWETRDSANDLLIIRSPPFSNPVRISFDIMGGGGLASTPVQQPTSDNDIGVGYLGVCLRKTLTGQFVQCYSMDCGSVQDGWSGSVDCNDVDALGQDWQSSGISTWQHIEWDVGHFVTDTVTQFTFELIDNYGGGPWAHIELQDVTITAALVDETPNQFYSESLTVLRPMVTVQSASGATCVATGTTCTVSGTGIRPSLGMPPPFGLAGYTFHSGDALMLTSAQNDDGVDIDGTWTVDCFIQTPIACTNCNNPDAEQWTGWHTLVRGKVEDHPALLWNQDESTLGAYDNGGRNFVPTTFRMSSLADGWHRLTITGNEGQTLFFVDGEQVGSISFTATESIYWVGNTGADQSQQWGDLAGFMLFDEVLTAGQVAALYSGACVSAMDGRSLVCQEQAELTSRLQVGDQVEHAWRSMVPALCHAPSASHPDGLCEGFCHTSNAPPPDPMLARGTVCGFDGSLVLIRWDFVSNTAPSNLDHPNCGGCTTHPDDGSCTGGAPYWTRLQNEGGAPRDPEWLSDWVGDPGHLGGRSMETCGVAPTESELRGAIPPFELSKISCTHYPLGCTEQAPEVINAGGKDHGGHRRAAKDDTDEEVAEQADNDAINSSRRRQQSMGIHARTPKPGHSGLDSGDTQTCSMTSVNAMAENVDADCCYQNGVYQCTAESQVPESCSYACGAVLVPFVDECHELLTASFSSQLDSLTQLYNSCLNADARVLSDVYNSKECCTASNCGGCKSQESCAALTGQCDWGGSTGGRQVDTRCNCVLAGMTDRGIAPGQSVLAQQMDAFPDFASCSAACDATVGCNFFAVFEETPGDHDFPDYCRMWESCPSCERSVHFNTVYQLHSQYEKTPDLTWTDAEQYCVANGGHLVSIHSQAEHDAVWAVARGDRVWIGLNDRMYDADLSGGVGMGHVGAEGQWVWTDGTPADFFLWTDPQPDNAAEGDEHEDCGELYDGYGGGWNDRICSSVGPGVCHYTTPPPPECQRVENAPTKYVRVDQAMDFDDAQSFCRSNYHDLASIHNAQENSAALLACQGGGTSAIIGDWADHGDQSPFYGGSVVHISETPDLRWSVEGDTYVEGDTLTIRRIGNGFLLNEHDTASNHDYGHMVTIQPDGRLKVFTRPGGNAADDRTWYLTRVSAPPQVTDVCFIGFRNSGPGKQWAWSDGSPAGFQNWLGAEGGVAENNARDAAAGIGLCDTVSNDRCNAASAAHWDDRPAEQVRTFLCERYE